jgi:hypothetical protein
LKQLKESNPIEVTEYAKANQLDAEPAFDWWVSTVLRHRKRIIKTAQTRHKRAGYKFGVRLPRTNDIADAKALDRQNGNTLWMDALHKEMNGVMVAFEPQPEGTTYVPGNKKIPGFFIWDIKMDFTHKAR